MFVLAVLQAYSYTYMKHPTWNVKNTSVTCNIYRNKKFCVFKFLQNNIIFKKYQLMMICKELNTFFRKLCIMIRKFTRIFRMSERLRLVRSVLRASKFSVLKLI